MVDNPQWPNAFDIAHIATGEGQRALAHNIFTRTADHFWKTEFHQIRDGQSPFLLTTAAEQVVAEVLRLDINAFDLVAVLGKNAATQKLPRGSYIRQSTDFEDSESLHEAASVFAVGIIVNELSVDETIVAEDKRRLDLIQ